MEEFKLVKSSHEGKSKMSKEYITKSEAIEAACNAVEQRWTRRQPMKLVSVSHGQSRLNFFRYQLATANRRLDWSMKHNPDWYDHSEKGEVVSFYEWAVKMAEKEVEDNEP